MASTVLVVDDERSSILLLANMLKEYYRVIVTTAGEKAIKLANDMLDIILLDVEMPGMNGYEVCTALKANEKTRAIPVIFLTGKDSEVDEYYGFELGAVDYVIKPFRPTLVMRRISNHISLKQKCDKLEYLATHDQLTGLHNRHHLLETASKKIAESIQQGFDLCLLVIDVDHFKRINDRHGHVCGDMILRAVASVIASCCRQEDLAARFGGEEFVVLLNHCGLEDGVVEAQQIRKTIELHKPHDIDVTVSIGISSRREVDDNFKTLFSRADSALYNAKNSQRNCVITELDDQLCYKQDVSTPTLHGDTVPLSGVKRLS